MKLFRLFCVMLIVFIFVSTAIAVESANKTAKSFEKDRNGCIVDNIFSAEHAQPVWSGQCVEGYAQGEGELLWYVNGRPIGASYNGHMEQGVFSEVGIMQWPNGMRYEGEWKNGMREGYGTLYYPVNHEYINYKGQWQEDFQHGKGTLVTVDNQIIDGYWLMGKYSDDGSFYYLEKLLPVFLFLWWLFDSVALYYIARKTGTHYPWRAFVPLLDQMLICNISGRSSWYFLLFAIPLVGYVFYAMAWMGVASARDKNPVLGIAFLFRPLDIPAYAYLAWSK